MLVQLEVLVVWHDFQVKLALIAQSQSSTNQLALLIDELRRKHHMPRIIKDMMTMQHFFDWTTQGIYWGCWSLKCDTISISWHVHQPNTQNC